MNGSYNNLKKLFYFFASIFNNSSSIFIHSLIIFDVFK